MHLLRERNKNKTIFVQARSVELHHEYYQCPSQFITMAALHPMYKNAAMMINQRQNSGFCRASKFLPEERSHPVDQAVNQEYYLTFLRKNCENEE